MPKSNADIVSHWFAERMASGDIARDNAAHQQAIDARADLVKRLDAAKGQGIEAVNAWFGEKIATGAIARNTPAFSQAAAAKAELIRRLTADVVSAPANAVRQAVATEPKTAKPSSSPARAPAALSISPAQADTEASA